MSTILNTPQSPGASCPPPFHPLLLEKYNIGSLLGRGCFARVYRAIRRSDNHSVAIKVVEKARLDDETAHLLHNELQILQVVSQHPGIVTLLDSFETDTHMYFILDYVDGGPLLDRIVLRGSFSENDARIMLRSILITLQFLSDLGFVHRDIKPENILVDNNSTSWPVKLTDFGLSAKMQPHEPLYGALGTPLFVAPEILKGEGYDCSCDMWSLGVVLYIVLCGYPPFHIYDSPKGLIQAIIACNYSFPRREWEHVSENAKDFLSQMLESDPKRRLTPAKALEHPWIKRAQSTNTLPNGKLKLFNARRKVKAVIMAVRTTVEFVNIIQPSADEEASSAADNQLTLVEEVEKSRQLIQSLGLDEPFGNSSKPSEFHHGRSKPIRKSLILPMGFLQNATGEARNGEDVGNTDGCRRSKYNMLYTNESGLVDSKGMHSKAKAMVEEVRNSAGVEEMAHLFGVPKEGDTSTTEERVRRPKSLKLLDFSPLGLS